MSNLLDSSDLRIDPKNDKTLRESVDEIAVNYLDHGKTITILYMNRNNIRTLGFKQASMLGSQESVRLMTVAGVIDIVPNDDLRDDQATLEFE